MTSRIVIPYGGDKGPDTTPPASAYDLGQKVRSALTVGLFVWVGGTILFWTILLLLAWAGKNPKLSWMRPPWGAFVWAWLLAFIVGALVTCYHGFYWTVMVAVRPWLVDDRERERRWMLEDKAREEQEEAAARAKNNIKRGPMDHDRDPATLTLEQELHLVAWEMLARACLGRGKPTREEMVGDGCCTQQQWNVVNEAMQKVGLRKGYTWQVATFDQAWDTFRANFRVQQDADGAVYVWAMKPGGQWRVVERVQ